MKVTHEQAVEIDTAIAEAYGEMSKAQQNLDTAEVSVLRYAGARQIKRSGRYVWNLEITEAEDIVEQGIADNAGESRFVFGGMWHGMDDLTGAITRLGDARQARAEAVANYRKLNEQYTGWSRFFLVNNTGGHIHSSMNCSTCRFDTSFSWLPTLSGLTEAEAVAAHGAILCTVCFPSAPVEWTNQYELDAAARDAEYCQGKPEAGTLTFAGYNNRHGEARCDTCGKYLRCTQSGALRKHKAGQ